MGILPYPEGIGLLAAKPMKHSLNIMHTTCHRQWGGLEKRIYNESCWMEKKGHKIIIAAPKNTPLINKALNMGWACMNIEFTPGSMLKDFLILKKLYRKLKPDILNTHGNTDSKVALPAAWASNIRCTILSRHISADVNSSWYNKLLYHKLCRYIFTTADYTTEHLISNFNIHDNRIFTVPSGITPPNSFSDHETAKKELSCELNISSDSKFIGFVGRVSADKGIMHIINAFLSTADKIPKHHLVIVGDGEKNFLDNIKTFFDLPDNNIDQYPNGGKHRNRIHFTGFQENTWPYYRAFDCNLLASTEVEGISQSLLEAMYARCPVAASRIGGSTDIIKHGHTGLLFKPMNAEEIAGTILQIVQNKSAAEKMVERAFQMVKEKHTIDSMGKRILKIYEQSFL